MTQAAVSRHGATEPLLLSGACLFAAVTVVVVGFTPIQASPPLAVTLGVVAVLLACAAALVLVRVVDRADGSRASLVPVWVIYYGIVFGLSSLAWRGSPPGLARTIDPSAVPVALGLASLGVVTFAVGYAVGPPSLVKSWARRSLPWVFPGDPSRAQLRYTNLAVGLYALASAGRLVGFGTGNYGYLSDPRKLLEQPSPFAPVLALFDTLGSVALVVACLAAFHYVKTPNSRVVLGVVVVGEVVNGLIGAQKNGVIVALLIPLYLYWLAQHRIPVKAAAASALVILMAFPIVNEYRSLVRPDGQQRYFALEAAARLPVAARNVLQGNRTEDLFLAGASQGQARLRLIDNVAVITQRSPSQIPYSPPEELVIGAVVNLVPRAVWPGKPVLSQAYDFSSEYYRIPRSIYTSSAITVPGDLYMHGGLVVLLGGMTLLGAAFRTYNLALGPTRDLRRVMVYLPLFQVLSNVELDVVSLLGGVTHSVPVLFIAARLIFVSHGGDR